MNQALSRLLWPNRHREIGPRRCPGPRRRRFSLLRGSPCAPGMGWHQANPAFRSHPYRFGTLMLPFLQEHVPQKLTVNPPAALAGSSLEVDWRGFLCNNRGSPIRPGDGFDVRPRRGALPPQSWPAHLSRARAAHRPRRATSRPQLSLRPSRPGPTRQKGATAGQDCRPLVAGSLPASVPPELVTEATVQGVRPSGYPPAPSRRCLPSRPGCSGSPSPPEADRSRSRAESSLG